MRHVHRLCLGILVAHGALCAGRASAQAVLTEVLGMSAQEGFGSSVAIAGDVNGDGFDDVVIGGPSFAMPGGMRIGRALVVSGKNGTSLMEFFGTNESDNFGRSVAGGSDVDGDGFDDLLVGAPGVDLMGTDAGTATLFSGATGAVLYTLSGVAAYDGFGTTVAFVGDVDGDGHPDLGIGAPGDDSKGIGSGSVRVVSGATGSTLFLITGDSAYDLCGLSVAGAGDVNVDGHADVLVGEPGDVIGGLATGSVRLVSGADATVLYTWHDAGAGSNFGWSVSGLGDVDGDGVPDVAIGAPLDDSDAFHSGGVYLHSGAEGTLLRQFHGTQAGDLFGSSIYGAGDMNGDGIPELVVGAPFDHCEASHCGAAQVFSGIDGAMLFEFHGEAEQYLGSAVGGGGDADGDGHDDIIVGLPFADSLFAIAGGLARVYSATAWLNLSLSAPSGPGARGTAQFQASGSLQPLQPFTLSLSGTAPLAPSVLVLGLSVINAPFKGATLVPHPDFVSTAVPTSAAGELTLGGLWPDGLPPDLKLTLQWWTLDPTAASGLTASNALQAVTP